MRTRRRAPGTATTTTSSRRTTGRSVGLRAPHVVFLVLVLLGGTVVGLAVAPPAVASTQHWHPATPVTPPHGQPVDVACPGPALCFALDAHGWLSSWNGTRWTAPVKVYQSPDRGAPRSAVDTIVCGSPTSCLAGDVAGGTDEWDGSYWHPTNQDAVRGAGVPVLAVTGPASYLALTPDGRVRTFLDRRWSDAPAATGAGFDLLSCAGRGFCLAVDHDADADWVFDGAEWIPTDTSFVPRGVSCVSTTWCLGVRPDGGAAVFDGTTWHAVAGFADVGDGVDSVSCSTRTVCVAAGDTGVVRWDGTDWGAIERIDPTGSSRASAALTAVDCGPGNCAVLSGEGVAWTTSGDRWTRAVVDPDAGGVPTALSCPSRVSCLLVDEGGDVVHYDGVAWTLIQRTPNQPFAAVDCVSVTFCAMVGRDGRFRVWDGAAVTVPVAPRVAAATFGPLLRCASTRLCVAVDLTGDVHRWDGGQWTVDHPLAEPVGVAALSCVRGTTVCVAAGASGATAVLRNGAWSPSATMPLHGVTGLSCPSARECFATTQLWATSSWDGTSWTAPTTYQRYRPPSPTTPVCVAGLHCLVTDEHSITRDIFPGRNAPPDTADPFLPPEGRFFAMTCPVEEYCMAVDTDGAVVFRF